jgi:hypothetical protein
METHEAISTLLGYTLKEDKNPPAEVIKAIGHIIRLEAKKEVEEYALGKLGAMENEKEIEQRRAELQAEQDIWRDKKYLLETKDAIICYCKQNQTINPKWVEDYNRILEKLEEMGETIE